VAVVGVVEAADLGVRARTQSSDQKPAGAWIPVVGIDAHAGDAVLRAAGSLAQELSSRVAGGTWNGSGNADEREDGVEELHDDSCRRLIGTLRSWGTLEI
jgi:hypothetical protein